MHPHPRRDWVLSRPRMRQETRGEDREVLLPPSSRPSSNIGGGWNSSPSPSDTRVQRAQGPSTVDNLTTAFATFRPRVDHTSASKDTTKPITDSNAKSRGYRLFNSLLAFLLSLLAFFPLFRPFVLFLSTKISDLYSINLTHIVEL